MTSPQDNIDDAFEEAVGEIFNLYDNDELEECVDKAEALLRDMALPRYLRVRTLCVLANIVPDSIDARNYHLEAELLYRQLRQWHPPGVPEIDEIFDHLRTLLDDVRRNLDQEMADMEEEHEIGIDEMESDHGEVVDESRRVQAIEKGSEDDEDADMSPTSREALRAAAAEASKEKEDTLEWREKAGQAF